MRVRGALYFVLAFAATAAVIEWHVVLSLDLISTLTTDTSSTASPLRRSLGIQEATTAISDNCAAYRADCDRIMGELDVSPPCPVTSGRAASCHTLATVGVARSLLVRFWGFFPPTDASHGCIPRMHQLDTALGEEPPVAVEFAAYTKSDWSDALAH